MIDKYIYNSHFLKLEEEMIEEHNHILNNYQVTNAHNKYTKEIYANNIKDYFFLNKTYKLKKFGFRRLNLKISQKILCLIFLILINSENLKYLFT